MWKYPVCIGWHHSLGLGAQNIEEEASGVLTANSQAARVRLSSPALGRCDVTSCRSFCLDFLEVMNYNLELQGDKSLPPSLLCVLLSPQEM